MKSVVCVKQVPATTSVSIDPETKRLVRDGVASVFNPFDYAALEQAILIREALGGTVTVITMGPPKAEQVLREAIAIGADAAVLLSDRRFGGSDTWATSYVLAQAIRKIGDVDCIYCGKQAIDGDTAQVGSGIAAHLGIAQASGVAGMEAPSGGGVIIRRLADDGVDVCRVTLPGVFSVVKELNEPRVPRLAGWLRAEKAIISTWDADALACEAHLLGLKGSPTRVVKTGAPAPRHATTHIIRSEPAAAARELIQRLRRISAL